MNSASTVRNTQSGLNPMQLHLINMLNFNSTIEAQQRLQEALRQFYLSEFERAKSEMFESGELNEDLIEKGAKKHFRTSY